MKSLKMLTMCVAAIALWGAGTARAVNYTSYTANSNVTLAAGDTLTVSSGNVDISYGGSGTGLARTLDASLADSVIFTIDNLRIGTRSDPTNTSTSDRLGTLNLGADNTITASSLVSIGGGGHIVSGVLTTAANTTTVISTPVMDIGTAMRTSSPSPNLTIGSGSTFTLQGIEGGRTALIVGEERYRSGGINWSSSGAMDLSGGQATLKLSRVVVGSTSLSNSDEVGFANGTLTMSSNANNQLDISGSGSVVRIGTSAKSNTDSRNSTTGTVTIGHLGSNSAITSTDNGDAILIGHNTGSASRPVTGTLNLNGGTVTITTSGAAIAGGTGGGTSSTLNLSGGVKLVAGLASTDWIKNLDSAVIGSGGAAIDTNGNNVGVSQAFSGTGGLIKDGLGILELSGTNTYDGTTQITAGTLMLSGSVDGDVNVGANGTLSGSGYLGGNIHFDSGSRLAFDSAFTTASGKTVSFDGFSVTNILGLDEYAADGTYTLIGGPATINWANVTNVGEANKVSIGGTKSAYFKSGSLQLVVIPEPATFGIVLSVLAAAIIRRKRFG